MSVKYAQIQYATLAGSGASALDTSIVLTQFLDIDGNPLVMTDFGEIGFATLEPNNSTQEEQIAFTGITQNADGTATLTGIVHVTFLSPYTQTSGLTKSHPGGAKMIVSNTSGYYNTFANRLNSENIVGLYDFDQFPVKNGSTTNTNAAQFATKAYVDATAGGIATTDSVQITVTAGETIVAPNVVYFKESDQRWWKVDADALTTSQNILIGVAQGGATAGTTFNVIVWGNVTNMSGLVAGSKYYVSSTAAGLTATPTGYYRFVGRAVSGTQILWQPEQLEFNEFRTATSFTFDSQVNTGGIQTLNSRYSVAISGTAAAVTATAVSGAILQAGTSGAGYAEVVAYGSGLNGLTVFDFNPAFSTAVSANVLTAAQSKRAYLVLGGISPFATNTVSKHIGFELKNDNGTGKVFASVGSGTVRTTAAIAGITITATNLYHARLISGSRAEFYVNNVLLAVITTNLPSGAMGAGGDAYGIYVSQTYSGATGFFIRVPYHNISYKVG